MARVRFSPWKKIFGYIEQGFNVPVIFKKYLNFGSTSGESGYGIRDEGGRVQVKHEGESWVDVPNSAGGTVNSVVGGTGIDVDATDPANPVVDLDAPTIASLALADSALQSGDNVSELNNDAGYTTNTGTVTSVAVSGSDGLEVDSGSPITGAGTIALGVNKTNLLAHINVEDGAEVNNISDVNATDLTDGGNTTLHIHDSRYYTETETDTLLNAKINTSEKGANNGVATLDGGGKVPSSQLPSTVMEFLGTWNASTNTPALADGVGNAGDVYTVSVAGTQNLGSGAITFGLGDWAVYSGTVWQKSDNSDDVVSVNGQQGTVVLDADNISDASTTNKWSNSTEKTKLSFISITQAVDLDDIETLATGAVQTTRTISTTAPLAGGGDLSANRTLSIPQATGSADGYLSSTDWSTFNGKQSAIGYTPENVANKENTTIDTNTTKYPTINLLKTGLDTKQATLVSATNIKTINGNSLLGAGDLAISSAVVWGAITGTLSSQTDLQTALNTKQATITGAASSVVSIDLTANRVAISSGTGKITNSTVTTTELGYLSGVTSAIQTQLNAKLSSISGLDHNSLGNLTTGDVHTQYLRLNGRTGGQTVAGGVSGSGGLNLTSNASGSKTSIVFGSSAIFQETTGYWGMYDQQAPDFPLHLGLYNNVSSGLSDSFIVAGFTDNVLTGGKAEIFTQGDQGGAFSVYKNDGTIASSMYIDTVDTALHYLNEVGSSHLFDGSAGELARLTPTGLSIGTTEQAAKLQVSSSTGDQFRLNYDSTNRAVFVVGSNGSLTVSLNGTTPKTTFSQAVIVPTEVYGSGWNGSNEVATKDALHDKFEDLIATIPKYVATTGDSVTSTTLVDVSGLSIALTAGTYIFETHMSASSSSAAGARWGVNYSGTTTSVFWTQIGQTSATAWAGTSNSNTIGLEGTTTSTTAGAINKILLTGRITVSDSGNFTVRARKVTSGTLTIQDGGWLRLSKV